MKLLHNVKWLMALTPLLFVACDSSSNSSDTLNKGKVGDGRLSEIVAHHQEKYNIPAMAVFTVNSSEMLEQASVGVGQVGKNSQVQANQQWNIGSITKSMTATLVGVLVDQGVLSWDMTLVEVFPEQRDTMIEQYKTVTLIELLSHTSGFPQDGDDTWEDYLEADASVIEQRYHFTQEVLAYPTQTVRGAYLYSNINYVVTSAILERVTSLSYETLLQTYLFEPLAMQNSGVDTKGQFNDIWGHKEIEGQLQAIDPSVESSDNAKIVAPAGSRTFVTLEDMSNYLRLHLQAKMGQSTTLMSSENFTRLHTKVVDADSDLGYALGWFTEADYGLQHSGSNGQWFALSFINADRGFAYFVVANAYKPEVEQAVYDMMKILIDRTKEE